MYSIIPEGEIDDNASQRISDSPRGRRPEGIIKRFRGRRIIIDNIDPEVLN
jgi:hypothetical protein